MKRTTLTLSLLLLALAMYAQSETDMEVGVVEHLDEFIPMDAMLVNEKGDTVIIGDLIDKPTILNLGRKPKS